MGFQDALCGLVEPLQLGSSSLVPISHMLAHYYTALQAQLSITYRVNRAISSCLSYPWGSAPRARSRQVLAQLDKCLMGGGLIAFLMCQAVGRWMNVDFIVHV